MHQMLRQCPHKVEEGPGNHKLSISVSATGNKRSMDSTILWEKIKLSWQSITEQVRFRDHGDYLMTKNAFSFDDFDRIRTMHGKDQTHEMLLTMRRKSPESVFDFMDSLRRECIHVAREIEDKVVVIAEATDSNTHAGAQTETNYKQLVEELEVKLKETEASYSSQVQELQERLKESLDTNRKLGNQIQEMQESMEFTKWKLPEGWQKDVVVEKVVSIMTEELEHEAMSVAQEAVSKQSSINTLVDLKSVATIVSDTFNDRHGKCWQCVVGQAGLFEWRVWHKADMFISLNVKLPAIKSLRVVLFKAPRNEWFYPVGWKDHLTADIVQSGNADMSELMIKDAKQLVLQAVSRQSAVDTMEDMNGIAAFISDTWNEIYGGYWHVVAGERGRYGGYVQFASGSCINLDVELTAVKEGIKILLFKAEQDE